MICAPAHTYSATPINDLGTGLYLHQYQGGLYPNGSNVVPAGHAAVGVARAASIEPLNTRGQPHPSGKFVFISIGMSNMTQEFSGGTNGSPEYTAYSFMGQAAAHTANFTSRRRLTRDHANVVIHPAPDPCRLKTTVGPPSRTIRRTSPLRG